MFYSCTSLTTVPELPATTLASDCYRYMFASCPSLTTVPSDLLPATTLASNCYRLMFQNCTSLTTAPELLATTLTESCYHLMFNGCTSLTTAPELPTTTLADSCYYQMFSRCTSLTTAPELPATTLADSCYYQMFNRCTSLTTAPELPATTLAVNCYYQMFLSCTSLSSIKCLATDISASNCTYNWVNGVAASGTFTKAASMTGWTTGVNGIPSGWVTEEHHDYVEIGGLKWATMNVGANSVTDYGQYFQWGSTTGFLSGNVGSNSTALKKPFAWADYKFSGGRTEPGDTGMTKYNSGDTKTVLDMCDDAARANWGGQWRMPTAAEYTALGAAVNTAWTADYQGSGVAGLVLTDKTDSSKVLFFPAAGLCLNGSVTDVGRYGIYWSSSVRSSGVHGAYSLGFASRDVSWQSYYNRCYGFAVRGVLGE